MDTQRFWTGLILGIWIGWGCAIAGFAWSSDRSADRYNDSVEEIENDYQDSIEQIRSDYETIAELDEITDRLESIRNERETP